MRRFSSAFTTDTHPLHATFLKKLSACIFEWDAQDLANLRRAKVAELRVKHIPAADVDSHLTKDELAKHCKRRTRGTETTTRLIQGLIDVLDTEQGCDTMGVPLFHHERIQDVWETQQRHVKCIQDVPGYPLYRQTGTITKGGVVLKVYRCARGSTSLESFHKHVANFVPG